MKTCVKSLLPQQLCYDLRIQDGDSLIGSVSHQERGRNVLCQFKGHLLSNPDVYGLSTFPSDCLEWEGFSISRHFVWAFFTALQVFTRVFSLVLE